MVGPFSFSCPDSSDSTAALTILDNFDLLLYRQVRSIMAPRKRQLQREKGSVVVEMAVAIPLLLLMVAGVCDLGMLLWQKDVMTNACREGARAGARAGVDGRPEIKPGDPTTVTKIRALVQDYLRKLNVKDISGAPITLDSSNCVCSWDTTTDPTMPTISVQLQNIPKKMMLLPNLVGFFNGGSMDNIVYLEAKTTMAAEWDPTKPPSP